MNELFLHPDRRETSWGIRYLLFEVLVFPQLLVTVNTLLGSPIRGVWLNVLIYSINLTAVLIIFRHFLAQTLKGAVHQVGHILITALLGLLLYWTCTILLSLAFAVIAPGFVNVNDANIARMAAQDLPAIAVSTVVLVPAAEELLFRGALFGGFYAHYPKASYAISTAGFCIVHISSYIGLYSWGTLLLCFLQYIPAGLCLAGAYRRSGSILTPIVMHAVINAVGIFAMR